MNLADEFASWVFATIAAKEARFRWIVEPRNYVADGKRSGPPALRFVLKPAFDQWYEYRRRCGLPRVHYEKFVPLWKARPYVLKMNSKGFGKGQRYSLVRLCDVDLDAARAAGVEVILEKGGTE